MLKDQSRPDGPRPGKNSSPVRPTSFVSRTSSTLTSVPKIDTGMLTAPAINNHALFSFGRDVGAPVSTEFPFLPSVSFDDLQSSLESASTDFRMDQLSPASLQEPVPQPQAEHTVDRTTLSPSPFRLGAGPNNTTIPSTSLPARKGSLLKKPGRSSRHPSAALSQSTHTLEATTEPAASAALRARRQKYPPVSSSNLFKQARKPVPLGTVSDTESRPHRRRPGSGSNGDAGLPEAARSTSTTTLFAWREPTTVGGRMSANRRAAKAKSVQPPQRPRDVSLAITSLTPDDSHLSLPARSPDDRSPGGKTAASAASRRMSVIATGLGARTRSPTDTHRMKRMSIMPQSQSLQQLTNLLPLPLPPSSTALNGRDDSRSPSVLPRKASATPSSSRTTPDITRKSYSSGLSIGSGVSYNTVRTSTGSLHRIGLSVPPSTSRLPALKAANLHTTAAAAADDEDEDVPPVPAIPKAYESPIEPLSGFLGRRRTGAALDDESLNSSSTGRISINLPAEPIKRKGSTRKSTLFVSSGGLGVTRDAEKSTRTSSQSAKKLVPSNLPPIHLGPLGESTTAKIAALRPYVVPDRHLTSTPPRQKSKTPTTPLTAKASYLPRHHQDENSLLSSFRSSSSVYGARLESPIASRATTSSDSLAAISVKELSSRMPNFSPFSSSSAPKSNVEAPPASSLRRSRTDYDAVYGLKKDADFSADDLLASNSASTTMPPPPRDQRDQRAIASTSKSPYPLPSPDLAPPTPSSISSIRRRLSMSWRRNNSKPSLAPPAGLGIRLGVAADSPDLPTGKDVLLHTRKPTFVSASTTESRILTSPSVPILPIKTYLDASRRKGSGSSFRSSLSNVIHHRDDVSHVVDVAQLNATSEQTMDRLSGLDHEYMARRRLVTPKASFGSLRSSDIWTSELDKDDQDADDEMRRLGTRRKETESAARTLEALYKRASPKERVSPEDAIHVAKLNMYEIGEIIDYREVFFCGTQNAQKVQGMSQANVPNFGYDDERGDYTIVTGDHLAYRYEIVDILGKGSFGQVVRCIDHKTGTLVAVKIIRNKRRFHQQALVEVNILKKLREWDPKNKHSMVTFGDSFYFRGHLCIATELLDMNLYELIKAQAFRGLSLKIIRRFTKQLLGALNLLKQRKVIHCDLKPENILLRHPLQSEIRVIDFGSSCFENEQVYTYIQSRFYRSPEVILGMSYALAIDMWSLGCILAELYTGVPIFPGENEQEQLACIMEVFGPPEKHLIEKSTRKKLFFDSMGKPRLIVSSKGRRRRPSSKTLQQVLKCDDEAFLDFLARCLRWDPERRLRPEEAIRHEFVSGYKSGFSARRPGQRDSSPIKRTTLFSSTRPLPEPPSGLSSGAGSGRGVLGASLRLRESLGTSPQKYATSATRRTSVAAGAAVGDNIHGAMAAPKRSSVGAGGISFGTSNLPRPRRMVSSKQDFASAGATVAMGRRG